MSDMKFKLNREGVRQLMRSSEMMNVVQGYAAGAVRKLGVGYTQNSMTGKNRVNAMVYAETAEAKKENAKSNTILKAVRG